jgi:hypothetical protein
MHGDTALTARRRLLLALAASVLCLALGAPAASATVSQFGAKGTGAGEFVEPTGIAVVQQTGDVYVVDTNNSRVDSSGPEGAFRFAIGWGVADGKAEFETCTTACRAGIPGAGAGQFRSPHGVAVDNDAKSASFGDFYIVDSENHRVQKFDAEGHFLLTFGKGVNHATEGNVCTSAEPASCGEGQFGLEPGELSITAGGVGVGPGGVVYVGDFGRVEKFTPEGEFITQWTVGEGFGLIPSLAVNSAGEAYVLGEALIGVHRYDQFGTEVGSPFATEGFPRAVTLGPSGEVYVDEHEDLETEQPHLAEYEPNGTQLRSFDVGTEGGSRGIAFGDAIDRVYVLNAEAVRLVPIPPVGPFVAPGSEVTVDAKPSHVKVRATLIAEGSPTQYRFEYGKTEAYGSSTAQAPLSEEGGLFTAEPAGGDLTGLEPNTVYHFRAVAEDGSGHTTFGPDATLRTSLPVLITGESAIQVTPESARLEAAIDPQGASTTYQFQYGLTTAYEHSVPEPPAEAGEEELAANHSIVIEHLEPGTTYHYRVVAHNSFGTSAGPDQTFTTMGPAATALADGRIWEMVSPPDKNGAALEAITEEGGLIEASEKGDALTYVGKAPVGQEAEPEGSQSISDSQFVSRRQAAGVWQTEDITTPHHQPPGFSPGKRAEYLLFTGDLSKAVLEPFGATPLSSEATERTPYAREPSGNYTPLVTASNVPPGTKFGGQEQGGGEHFVGSVKVAGASQDLSSVILASPQALTQETTAPEGNESPLLYRWKADTRSLQLVSWLPPTTETPELSSIQAGVRAFVGLENTVVRHAVSRDGNRVVFETETPFETRHLFLRDIGKGESVQLDLHEDGTSGSGEARFQDASADDRVIYFTDKERLTANATGEHNAEASDLYRCEIQEVGGHLHCALRNITVPLGAKELSDVLGTVAGTDEGGGRVYFVANGRLAPGAARGDCPHNASEAQIPPADTSCNLYAYDAGSDETRLIGVLSGQDFPDWGPQSLVLFNLQWITTRVSPNGRYLAFMSNRSLTGYDNRDASSGAPDEEVFEYDFAKSQLTCVSCDRTAARPSGVRDPASFPGLLVDRPQIWGHQWLAAAIPGWTAVEKVGSYLGAPYQSRYLSNDGRLFFNARDGLVPQDVNGQFDVYEYEPSGVGSCGSEAGCVALMSSGRDGGEMSFLDASEDGDDVFFLTAAKLSPNDTDTANDVYDAHVCPAGAACSPVANEVPERCEELESCRAISPQQVAVTAPPALGDGNVTPSTSGPPAAKPPTRAQRLARALKQCRRKHGKRRRACEASARRRFGPKHGHASSARHRRTG